MADNKRNQDRLKEITAGIEQGIKDLFGSDKYKSYLQTMSRFHNYSINNLMLIHAQKPDATRVAGFNKWKKQFGRHVKKGEKGIQILAPIIYKKKVEEALLDPDTKAPILDENGKAVMEEKEITMPRFKVVFVYDVAQTEGKPLPELASDLHGNVEQFDVFMEALRRSSPVPIEMKSLKPSLDGYFSPSDQKIAIREGMSQVQTVSAVIHEITHSMLHDYDKQQAAVKPQWKIVMVSEGGTKKDYECGFDTEAKADARAEEAGWRHVDENEFEWRLEVEEEKPEITRKDNRTQEVEAESVSYSVSQYYGIETGDNSFGYIASWSAGKELKELKASLETIRQTASTLITSIDKHFAEICKEQGITKEPEAPVIEEAPVGIPLPDPTITVEAMQEYGYVSEDMLPLSKDRAKELFERDCTVYMLYDGNTEAMVFDPDDIEMHTGIFGVSREEWSQVFSTMAPAAQENVYEKAFLEGKGDCFVIYQHRDTDAAREVRFMDSEWMEKNGFPIEYDNYEAVYQGDLPKYGDTSEKLEQLFETFNVDRPADFTGHSLSVSDIVAIRQNGVVSCHYVDSVGFKELPAFLPENYLKNAEVSMEDDYGMIDGIINNGPREEPTKPTVADLEAQVNAGQTISLMDLADAVQREKKQSTEKKAPVKGKEKKPSVLAKLKYYQSLDTGKTTQRKAAERDL